MSFLHLNDLKESHPIPGFHGRFVHSDHITLAFWHIDANTPLPEHSHPHEQIVHVIAGELDFTMNGITRRLNAGSVVIIPSNVTHSGKTFTDCEIVDAFYPVREDFKKL